MAVDTRRTLNGRSYREFFTPLFDEFLEEARSSDFDAEQYPPSLLRLFAIDGIQIVQHMRAEAAPEKLPDKIVEEIEKSECEDILEFLRYLETEKVKEENGEVAQYEMYDQPTDTISDMRQQVSLPTNLSRHVMDRYPEVLNFRMMLDGIDPEHRLMRMVGDQGQGKTWLLSIFQKMAEEKQMLCLRFDLSEPKEFEEILDEIWRRLETHNFPTYSLRRGTREQVEGKTPEMWRFELTKCFFTDWQAIKKSRLLVLLFDTFEHADPALKDWVENDFLERLKRVEQVIVVFGGRQWPKIRKDDYWHEHGYSFPLNGVRIEDYEQYAEQRGLRLEPEELTQLHQSMNGLPKLFAEFVEARLQGGV